MPGSGQPGGVAGSAWQRRPADLEPVLPSRERISSDNLEPVAGFAAILDAWADSHPEQSQCELARRLGIPEQTFRRYRHGHQAPRIDGVMQMLARPNTTDLLFRLLLMLAGRRYTVVPIEPGTGPTVADQAARLRELAIEAGVAPLETQRAVTKSLEDGRISADELVGITRITQAMREHADRIDAAASELCRRTR